MVEDRAIIRLLQRKPEKGIYEAIRKYEGVLSAIAGRILPDAQDIEECVSDAFVEVWKGRDRLDPEQGSLKGYLICTVRSKAINRYNQAKRNRTLYLSDEMLSLLGEDEMESQIMLGEDTGVLLELLGDLEEPEREIMLRRYFLFQPVKEVARTMALTPNQVKYRLQRTKLRLRDRLTEKGVAL